MKRRGIQGLQTAAGSGIRKEADRRLQWAAAARREELFREYGTDLSGYEEEKAEQQRELYGRNELTHRKKDSVPKRFVLSFVSPFTAVLIVLAAVSWVTDVLLAAPGKGDSAAVVIIGTIVAISGLLRFVQESRSGRAAEKLEEMVETTIAVNRKDRGRTELAIDELVAGDIVCLAAGDMVPADMRILQAKDLFVAQSSLTGESEPVEKFADLFRYEAETDDGILHKAPLECEDLVFMGSNVISGSAEAIVIEVGDHTVFGSIAKSISGKKTQTSFEKGVNSVSWVLIRFMAVMVPVVFLVNGFTKGSWMEAFLFALSVAVGLTPEMLPMLVSANLARGAVVMSRHQVVVKNLNAIQNFGAMDVLCTDKTGTLTQDKVVMLYSCDISGKEDDRILRHAFLNSYYQTGLKNLMDIAVIQYAQERKLTGRWAGYRKVDEIPFDFSRRRMSVVVDSGDKVQMITKGAVEEMLTVCSRAEMDGGVVPITSERKKEILLKVGEYNEQGMRVLAVAQKTGRTESGAFGTADEKDMVLMGYLAFLDPPKESAAGAIQALSEYGVQVKVLTGDNDAVTCCVCRQVGIQMENLLLGAEIEGMEDEELKRKAEEVNVFAKLSPVQKARVVRVLRENGHTVGFLGDGINDAAAMKEADVGISVDTAVDIAKETADIILLKKDLMILEQGVIEGRKTYANIIKYIKMTASSNFGNMFSVLAASAFLPFMPMMPVQLLALNLLYDISCLTIPWDNVDKEYLKIPRRWEAGSISSFMLRIGPSSSVFDICTYLLLYFIICPTVCGGAYKSLGADAGVRFMMLFQTGWFVESLWSQTLVIHMIRTPKLPFIQSRASWQVCVLTLCAIITGTVLPYTAAGSLLGFAELPAVYFGGLLVMIAGYMATVTVAKRAFVRHCGELL